MLYVNYISKKKKICEVKGSLSPPGPSWGHKSVESRVALTVTVESLKSHQEQESHPAVCLRKWGRQVRVGACGVGLTSGSPHGQVQAPFLLTGAQTHA